MYRLTLWTSWLEAEALLPALLTSLPELEAELDFLHDAKVCRCVTERDSNADIMMVMRIDSPDRLADYLQHPKHVALAQGLKDSVAARMSFDAE